MTDQDEEFVRIFEDVRNAYYNPPVSGPSLVDDKEKTAFLDMLNINVSINPAFVDSLSQHGSREMIIEGLFSHEIGHYILHPRNLSMNLYLSYMSEKAFGENGSCVLSMFTDFENDALICDNGLKADSLKEARRASLEMAKNKGLDPLTAAFYLGYKKSICLDADIDLGLFDEDVRKRINNAVDELGNISITSSEDPDFQYSQLYRFGKALEPLFTAQNQSRANSVCGVDDGIFISSEDVESLPEPERKKVEEAIDKLVKQLPKDKYEELKKHFLKKENAQRNIGIGVGDIDIEAADSSTIDYYRIAAKQHGIYIRPRRIRSFAFVSIPEGKRDFNPSDSAIGIDLRFSGGKIIPGLTKTQKKENIAHPTSKEKIPRLLIYKDASGSMPDPRSEKDHATIAAAIFALSYLRSGAEVGAALFDSETSQMKYSRKEDELLGILCGYKGGGTSIDMEKLRKDLEENSRFGEDFDEKDLRNSPFLRSYMRKQARLSGYKGSDAFTDFVVITDGGIGNIGEFVDFLSDNPNYRPTIIHTGNFELAVPEYDQKTDGVYQGITIYKTGSSQDIIDIARKTVRKNLLSKYVA